jgi:hypothetical protein
MKNSNNKSLRSKCARIGKLAAEIGLAVAVGAFVSSTALAARHDGGHGGNHGGYHGGDHGGYHGGYHGGGHWGGGYYAPGPDIYVAPEPYAYGYGGPAPCYGPYYEENCGPPPPSGVSLFFGL